MSWLPPNPPRPLRSLRCTGRVAKPQEKFDRTTFGRAFATKRKALVEQYGFLHCFAPYLRNPSRAEVVSISELGPSSEGVPGAALRL